MDTHASRPTPARTLLILGDRHARLRARPDDGHPGAGRPAARARRVGHRHHLDGHRLPAGRVDRDPDPRPPRRHVRQGAPPRDRRSRCSRSARSCARSRTRSTPMIVGRGLQGLGGGVFPLSFGIIRDEFPREKVPTGIAMLGRDRGDRLGHRPPARRRARRRAGLPLDLLARRRHGRPGDDHHHPLRAGVADPDAGPRRRRRRGHPRRRPDGAAVAISRGADWGWGSPRTLGLLRRRPRRARAASACSSGARRSR